MGIGEGVAMPAMNQLISSWVPLRERSRSLAFVYSGMQILFFRVYPNHRTHFHPAVFLYVFLLCGSSLIGSCFFLLYFFDLEV